MFGKNYIFLSLKINKNQNINDDEDELSSLMNLGTVSFIELLYILGDSNLQALLNNMNQNQLMQLLGMTGLGGAGGAGGLGGAESESGVSSRTTTARRYLYCRFDLF